jgi:hypothetical protein
MNVMILERTLRANVEAFVFVAEFEIRPEQMVIKDKKVHCLFYRSIYAFQTELQMINK